MLAARSVKASPFALVSQASGGKDRICQFLEETGVQRDVSRRSFLRSSALTAAGATVIETASAIIAQAQAAQSDGPPASGPGPVLVTLKVNGVERRLLAEPRMTLAQALRGPLGLTGTKIACDRGACSACTVWVDGLPVCSCMMLAIEIGARSVTTIEGLARGEALHPVQTAFIEHDALQCGFCTPGMVMSCAALLERVSDPTAEDVRAAISGHLCRCGTYPHVVAATLAAAEARKG
jgi:xanthine dehydrogenase YagT iron-sulfur-binding subunit